MVGSAFLHFFFLLEGYFILLWVLTVLILQTHYSNLLEVSANTANAGSQDGSERKAREYRQHLWRPKVFKGSGRGKSTEGY